MILAQVVGTVTSSVNHPFYDGKKLLLVDKCDEHQRPTGAYLLAVDALGVEAGPGERVLVLDEGNGSRQIFEHATAPVRSTIVGVVDVVTIDSGPSSNG